MDDTIRIGVYEGETVKDCIRKYGRKSILEIMKYYDLDEEILREYHYRSLEPHKDNSEKDMNELDWIQEILNTPIPVGETFKTSTTQDEDEETLDLYQEYENDLDCYDNPEDDEFGYPREWGNSYKPWIYGR